MVAEHGLGAELSLDVELLAPGMRIGILVLWVLNMLDFIILGSMDILP